MGSVTSPKVSADRTAQRRRWYNFYAMFSERFAYDAICRLDLPPSSIVLDPWLGSGTTTAVAAQLGYRTYGFDINPAMVVVSQARGTSSQTASRAKELFLSSAQRTETAIATDDPLLIWFHPVTARAIRFWNTKFENEAVPGAREFLQTSLFDCARQLAQPYKSKNPTWMKQPTLGSRVRFESTQVRAMLSRCIDDRIRLCPAYELAGRRTIKRASATKIPLKANSVDAVLSSPPYCTRIDYAVTTSVELAVLGVHQSEKQSLRNSTMGTSTVRKCSDLPVDSNLSPSYSSVIEQICCHSSKSSANYYAKTARQYFSDLAISLREIDRCARPNAHIVIVVQDSNYKDIHIDLAKITIDMGNRLRWRLKSREDFEASRNIRYVNSKSRQYQPNLRSTESVLTFCKV